MQKESRTISQQYFAYTASRFRKAIEKACKEGLFDNDIFMRRFPYGCCGVVSDMIGQYLLSQGIQTDYVYGSYYYDNPEIGTQSHAWLQYGNTIIDITGDQFKDKKEFLNYSKTVYAGGMDEFHKLFELDNRSIQPVVEIKDYDNPVVLETIHRLETIGMFMFDNDIKEG